MRVTLYEKTFCDCSIVVTSTEPDGFMFFLCFYVSGTTVNGSGLKRLRRRGNGLKSHSTDWWSWGTNSGPLVTRRETYSLHHADSLLGWSGNL